MVLDICITIIVFLVGFNLKNWFVDFSRTERKILSKLFFYHFLIAIAFHFYISHFGGDATDYWEAPKLLSFTDVINLARNGSASAILYLINYFPSNTLGLSFFVGNMIYALFGYLGFIYIFRIVKSQFPNLSDFDNIKLLGLPIFPWIWFLPNFHFWSSGIGKDTILFICIALFVYSFQNIKRRWVGVFISMLFSLLIRPHISLFLLVSFGVGYTLDGKLKGYQKILIFLALLIGFASIFNYVLAFIQLETIDANSVEDYVTKKAMSLNKNESESGIDISGYPFPLKVFTFLYRPLFIDSPNLFGILSSIENLFLLLFTGKVIMNKPLRGFFKSNNIVKSAIIFFCIGSAAFSLILGNLGIMLREKNMLVPYFIIFGYGVLMENYLKLKRND